MAIPVTLKLECVACHRIVYADVEVGPGVYPHNFEVNCQHCPAPLDVVEFWGTSTGEIYVLTVPW